MSTDFDWSGAPEGERWKMGGGYFVIGPDEVYSWSGLSRRWRISGLFAHGIRTKGTRVETPYPVVRVGDRARVTQTQTWEGHVTRIEDNTLLLDEHQYPIELSKVQVQVLQRADPPLEPGDLVRDADGLFFVYNSEEPSYPFCLLYNRDGEWDGSTYYPRDKLTGPLVKVELREVTS